MAQPQMHAEKRSTQRFSFNLPVMVKNIDGRERELEGTTRDVSSRGAFVYLSSEAVEGAAIKFVMILPADMTLAEPIRVLCSGKVLRVERSAQKQGIAVAIEKYDFIGDGQAAS
jgi:PilZ domain